MGEGALGNLFYNLWQHQSDNWWPDTYEVFPGGTGTVLRCRWYLKRKCEYKTFIIYHLHWKELGKALQLWYPAHSWNSVNICIMNIIKLLTRLKKKMLTRHTNASQAVVPPVPSSPNFWSYSYLAVSPVSLAISPYIPPSTWNSWSSRSVHKYCPHPHDHYLVFFQTLAKCHLRHPQVELTTPFL